MAREKWKDVPNYEGHYLISSHGRICSTKDKVGRKCEPFEVSPGLRKGYKYFALSKNGKYKKFSIHRLVLIAFVGPPKLGMQAGHLNGNPLDNRLENLKWITHQENVDHRKIHGTNCFGERNLRSKIKEKDAIEIFKSNKTQMELAMIYKIRQTSISNIKTRKTWKHATQHLKK